MNSKFWDHFFILVAYIVSLVISTFLGQTIIGTICYSVFGVPSEGGGLIATQVVMRILFILLALPIIHWRRQLYGNGYRAFKEKMKDKEYSVKEDMKEIARTKSTWEEAVFVSVITTLFWLTAIPHFWILINIPVFIGFQFLDGVIIHKIWLKDKRAA